MIIKFVIQVTFMELSICAVSQSFYPYLGGLTRYVNALGRQFVKNGSEFRVVHFKTPSIGQIDYSEGLELLRVNVNKLGSDVLSDYMRFKEIIIEATHGAQNANELFKNKKDYGFDNYLEVNRKVCEHIMEIYEYKEFDILHIHDFQLLPLRSMLKDMDIPVLFTWHIPFTMDIPFGWRKFIVKYMNSYDRVVLSTDEYVRSAVKSGLDKNKAVKINPFIDLSECRYDGENDARKRYGIGNNTMILCVSRMDPRKGQEFLIRAMKKIVQTHGDIKCVFVGNGSFSQELLKKERGGFRDKLEALAKELGIEKNIIFTGHVTDNDLYKFYDASDIVVQPSLHEGFGLTITEAMSFGKPVVGSNVGGIPEQIVDGKNGFLFAKGNSDELAAKLEIIISDSSIRRVFGENGRKIAAEKFSVEKGYEEHVKLYVDVLKK